MPMRRPGHFIKFFLAFSLIFFIGIFSLFVINRYGGGKENRASLLDTMRGAVAKW